jgi:peptidoglycan/LPS O-acetylase OafA/YrhL
MHMAGERWRLGHRPGLDGLRGVAILLVLAGHSDIRPFGYGGLVGVVVFFTLSGFLISTLLLEESDRTGRISIRNFYRRRALRLLPALFVMVAMVSLIGAVLPGLTSLRMEFGSLLYVGNWVRVVTPVTNDALGHTWSLSVEEQFYLLAPFVVICLRRRPRLLAGVSLAVAAASLLERGMLWNGGTGHGRVYYGTDTRLDALLIGVALAALMRARLPRAPMVVAWVGVGGLCWCLLAGSPVVMPTVAALSTVGLIAVGLTRPGALGARVLVWSGRRSYGLYLWHFPLLMLAARTGVPAVVAIVAAVIIAAASYRWVEQPFLRRRHTIGAIMPVAASQTPEAAQSTAAIVEVAASQTPERLLSTSRSVPVATSQR